MSVQIWIILINSHVFFVTIQAHHNRSVLVTGAIAYFRLHVYLVNHLCGKGRLVIGVLSSFLSKNRLCPLCPVFFITSFILLKFFIVLNKRKNWETGQKCENPLIFLGFLLPTFVLKTGQKLGRKWAEALFQCFWPSIFQQKLGRNWAVPTFWNIKLGRKLAVSQSEIRSQ